MDKSIIIPWRDLDPDTLVNLIMEIVTRDGTDYGWVEASMAQKVEQVKHKLTTGRAVIVFDQDTETCGVVSTDEPGIKKISKR